MILLSSTIPTPAAAAPSPSSYPASTPLFERYVHMKNNITLMLNSQVMLFFRHEVQLPALRAQQP